MKNLARKVAASTAAAVLSATVISTSLASPASAAQSSKTCESLGYKVKVNRVKVTDSSDRVYGEMRTLRKAKSPTAWCTYVLKSKKYRKKKHSVKLNVEVFTSEPFTYAKQRTSGKVKKRSKALTYKVVPDKRENGDSRVYLKSSVKVSSEKTGWANAAIG